jgi:hypothetical protein
MGKHTFDEILLAIVNKNITPSIEQQMRKEIEEVERKTVEPFRIHERKS